MKRHVCVGAGTPDGYGAANRRNLLIALLPVGIAVSLGVFSLVQRVVVAATGGDRLGIMTAAEARFLATETCARLLEAPARATETFRMVAYSPRSTDLRAWDVHCRVAGDTFVLRLNADTRQVISVNLLEEAHPARNMGVRSQDVAEVQARRCLNVMGVTDQRLRTLTRGTRLYQTEHGPVWYFTYLTPRRERRLVTQVGIHAATGEVRDFFAPGRMM